MSYFELKWKKFSGWPTSILGHLTVKSSLDMEKLRILDNANMCNTWEWGVGISSLTVQPLDCPHTCVSGCSGAQYLGQSSSPQLCRSSTSAWCYVGSQRHQLMPLSQAPHLPLPPSPSRNTAKFAEPILVLQHQRTCSLQCSWSWKYYTGKLQMDLDYLLVIRKGYLLCFES